MTTPAGDDLAGRAEIRVDADTDPALRALRRFSREAQRRISDVRGEFAAESAGINQSLTQAVGGDAALAQLERFSRDAQGRLRDMRGRFTAEANLMRRSLADAVGEVDDFSGPLERMGNAADRSGRSLTRLRLIIAGLSVSAGLVSPLLAGTITSLEQMAPAAGVAVSGLLAIQQASAAVKLGMVGVEDAVKAAFDTSDKGAEKFAEALEKLSPNARKFAQTIRDARDDLIKFQRSVQDKLFAGLDKQLKATAKATLPIFQKNLQRSATTLNRMGRGVAASARELAESGTLGRALAGANKGLSNLTKVPARVVTALAQIATAGAPALDRLTAKINDASQSIAKRLATAFESGALTAAINTGIGAVRQLGTVVSNVVGTLRNIAGPMQEAGGGIIAVLAQITGALREATATEEFQSAMGAFSRVTVTLTQTLGTLLGQGLAILGPALTTLERPAQNLTRALGDGLQPVLDALEPILLTTAEAVGAVSDAIAPLLPVLGRLTGEALSAVTPLLEDISEVVQQLAEQITSGLDGINWRDVGRTLGEGLAGAVESAIRSAGKLTAAFGRLMASVDWVGIGISLGQQAPALLLGLATGLLTFDIGALLRGLAEHWQEVLIGILTLALAPVQWIGAIGRLLARIPIVGRMLAWVLEWSASLARGMVSGVGRALGFLGRAFVDGFRRIFPAVGARFAAELALLPTRLRVWGLELLQAGGSAVRSLGDGIARGAAWVAAKVGELVGVLLRPFAQALAPLVQRGSALVQAARGALERFRSAIVSGATSAVSWVRGLPGRIRGALAPLGGLLAGVARSALSRFRSAAASGGSAAVNWARGLPGRIRGALSSLGGLLAGVARSALSRFRAAVVSGASSAVGVARSIPGRIRSAVGSLGGLLYGAGQDIVRGMINGLSSMAGSLASRARDMAASAVAAAKRALGISSPSRVFAQIGRDTGNGFIKGLTGTKRQIDQTADKVARSITAAFRGTGSRLDNRLVASIQSTNRRLQRLSVERDRIAQKIADAQKFATDLAAKARGTGSLGAIVQPDFFAPRFVEQRMRSSLAAIKRFTANVEKLRKRGLNRDLLRQVLELGPTQGAGFAASLATADKATIKRFNALQASIGKASTKLGRFGADALFDSGKKASQGFLTGLKAQQKSIESLMLRIAKGMQKAIRRALGIRSPSRVMAEVGRMSGLGLAGGLVRTAPMVDRAVGRLASTVATGVPNRLAAPRLGALDAVGALPAGRAGAGGGIPQAIHIHVHNEGVIGSRRELDNWLVGSIDRLRLQKRLRLAVG